MKKLFTVLLMLVYSLSSSGMTISLHYCCGKLDGVTFSAKQDKSCGKNNELKKSSCCNDKQISIKVNTEQELSSKALQAYKITIVAPVSNPLYTLHTQPPTLVSSLARGAPIPLTSIPLFVKNCVFRI